MQTEQASIWLKEYFHIEGSLQPLPGEFDQNYLVHAKDGSLYIFKISPEDFPPEPISFQDALLKHLADKDLSIPVPRLYANQQGEQLTVWKSANGRRRYLRLLSWLPGRLWAKAEPHGPALLTDLGLKLGRVTEALRDFDHPNAHRFFRWNPLQINWIEEHFGLFPGKKADLIRFFYQTFQAKAALLLPHLRRSVVHNDANDHNVLVSEDPYTSEVMGIIDFGDAIHTVTVNDLAVTIAYAVMGKPDPLSAACQVVSGFHRSLPLQEKEVEVLFPLVAARLLISLTISTLNQRENPENEYLQVSARPAWDLLEKWQNIRPAFAEAAFRHACGWAPCRERARFDAWLAQKPPFAPILKDLHQQKYGCLDLRVESLDLGHNENFLTITPFQEQIGKIMARQDIEIGVGGYGEIRPFYTTDAYTVAGNEGPQWRTVHLGLDLWAPAGTALYAPLAGRVHALRNNEGERNYGPTIILEHQATPDLTFYTLYGHLSLDSLWPLKTGMPVAAGQRLATIGPAPENGNWPPHLHFQVMLHTLELDGDFPGVGFPHHWPIWQSLCPDPNLLIGLAFTPPTGLHLSNILEKRRKTLAPNLSISYQEPLHMVRGYRQYLYASDGRRYLDTVNNVAHVGHRHPKVVQAGRQQMEVLNTNTRYLHENIVWYAEELLATLPPELEVVYFVNSGSEANELALRLAKTRTGQEDMLVMQMGYHGNTGANIELSSYKFDRKGGKGAARHIHKISMPDPWRGIYRHEPDPVAAYTRETGRIIEEVQSEGRNIAGFIGESILSCGGQLELPAGFLPEVYRQVRAAGGLCIADEVQVGFGRVGHHFWGFELHGVVPDIVTMGKPIGNGHPLGAVATTRAVADAFANGMEYFNTYGGNPVSCAIGRAVLEVIREEGLQAHARQMEQYLTEGLRTLADRHPIIIDVRGKGLFLGIELARGNDFRPATREAACLKERMCRHGILMSTDGPFENVLKIKPPMCFDKRDADFLLAMLDKVLREDVFK